MQTIKNIAPYLVCVAFGLAFAFGIALNVKQATANKAKLAHAIAVHQTHAVADNACY